MSALSDRTISLAFYQTSGNLPEQAGKYQTALIIHPCPSNCQDNSPRTGGSSHDVVGAQHIVLPTSTTKLGRKHLREMLAFNSFSQLRHERPRSTREALAHVAKH